MSKQQVSDLINTSPDTRTKVNNTLYKAFQECFKLPYWKDTMCHTTKSHKFDRQVVWSKICKEFGITVKQLDIVKQIHKKSYYGWQTAYQSIQVTSGNRARAIDILVKKEVIKVVEGSIIINPAILIAREGWSQYSLGIMLVQWLNERIVLPSLAPDTYSKHSIQAGAEYAYSDQDRVEIPHSIKGKTQGAIRA